MIEPFFTVIEEQQTKQYGKFVIEPLPQGFGHTIATSLRRILLTFLPGTAISFVKIKGVRHQFSTLPGLKEDIVEFMLNLKNIHFHLQGEEKATVTLTKSGPGDITAKDIELPANVTIANPDVFLGSLANRDAKIDATIYVEQGTGYTPSEERSAEEIGMIPVDSFFSPVVNVNFTIERTRVGRQTNYDKLILEITTTGVITPKEALLSASQLLVSFASHIYEPKITSEKNATGDKRSVNNSILKSSVDELELSVRVVNALKKGGFATLGDFEGKSRTDVEKVRNLGSKSIDQITKELKDKGIELS